MCVFTNLFPLPREPLTEFITDRHHPFPLPLQKSSKGCRFSPAALAFSVFIHSKRFNRSIAKIEGTLINTEHITYSFSVSATTAWLSNYRRAAGPALHPDGFFSSTQCVFSQSKIDFLLRLVVTQCGQDCRHGCGKLVFRQPCWQACP